MIGSLYTSVSGMNAFTEQLSVVSDNIANVETTGYKSSDIAFADVLSTALSSASGDSVGAGVEVQSISEVWNQGIISTTGSSTDLAINGSGFFIVEDQEIDLSYYTRDGGLEFDSSGTLVTSNGLAVQGYEIDEEGNLGALEDIEISYDAFPPSATTEMSTTLNLDSGTEEAETFSTTTTVYDSLGNEISVTIAYTKSATANEWTWTAEIPSTYGTLTGDTGGTITFDDDGALVSGADPEFTLELTNGADPTQTITWDIYDNTGDTNGTLTQYAGTSALYSQEQDGYASGELYDLSIDENGTIVGSYSNGETQSLYQVALADFNSYSGLNKIGDNLYEATLNSGQAIVGVPGTGQLGNVSGGSLETSNVDLATELSKLITAQRAYQACSRVFSVSSEILQTVVNLK